MGIALEIAKRSNALHYKDFPADAIKWSKVAIADAIAVSLAGSREPASTITANVLSAASQPGPSLVWGSTVRTRALEAALINGTSCHALDYDDTNNTSGAHPTCPILPAAMALAEQIGASGKQIIEAYVVGFETLARLSQAVQVEHHHYRKGWHPTGTLGLFGAAAACGRLLDLTDEQLATAFAICASEASGLKSNFGTYVKPLHSGLANRNGLFAVLMAKEGFTAGAEAFEHKQGFFAVYNGPGPFDAEKVMENWADPLEVVFPSMGIKQYPCCGSVMPVMDLAIKMRNDHNLKPDDIVRVEPQTHERRLLHTTRPNPRTSLDSKFSVEYCTARALLDGTIVFEQFEGDAHLDPSVRTFMEKIEAVPHTDDNHYGAHLIITLKDGTVLKEYTPKAKGRGPDHPLTEAELETKFVMCAKRALPLEQIELLYAACQDFESLTNVRDFTQLMETTPGARQAAE
ncbi:MAG: MmgE/PrpD family protein [Rhodospirillales bacterium]|jgi:2-methylcitrate dehydratase PrpD